MSEKLAQLKQVIPECFSEGKLDINKLRLTIGQTLDSNDEKYTFSWSGRSETMKNIQSPSKGTLVLDKKESVNFDNTENIFIEGENLEVLKILQKSYFGKIKMIYIDPPYNTGKDFIYKDNFQDGINEYLKQSGQSKSGIKLTTNLETYGRFHSNWLSFIYPRLYLARNLLKDDGIIFVSIDDNEVHNLILILNEIFGENNQLANIIWKRKRGSDNSAKYFSKSHEYLLVYAKNKSNVEISRLKLVDKKTLSQYKDHGDHRGPYRELGVWSRGNQGGSKFEFKSKTGRVFSERKWLYNKESLEKLDEDNRLIIKGDKIYRKHFLSEHKGVIPETLWDDTSNTANAADEIKKIFGTQIFDTAKPLPYIERMIQISTKKGDIILDFFAGSGTTAHAIIESSKKIGDRKFICIQIPEIIDEADQQNKNTVEFLKKIKKPLNISEIAKERIRRVINNSQIKKNDKNSIYGLKVFKLAKSNYRIWNDYNGKDTTNLKKQMKLFKNSLVAKYNDMDVIYECILKEGLELNCKIKQILKKPNIVYKIKGEKILHICLDKTISDSTITTLNFSSEDIFVCLDIALTDSQKTNISMTCKLRIL